jgi:hypothetical protein
VCLNNTFNPAGTAGCPHVSRAQSDSLVPKGSALPFSAEWTFNAGVQYTLHFRDLELTPRVQWSHLSSQLATPFARVETIVPSRDVLDARLSLVVKKRLTVEGFTTNFTDKCYIASQIHDAGSAMGGILCGAPRQYGVRAIWKFGRWRRAGEVDGAVTAGRAATGLRAGGRPRCRGSRTHAGCVSLSRAWFPYRPYTDIVGWLSANSQQLSGGFDERFGLVEMR